MSNNRNDLMQSSVTSKIPSLPPIQHLPPRKRLSFEKNRVTFHESAITPSQTDVSRTKKQPLKKNYGKTAVVASIIANQNRKQQYNKLVISSTASVGQHGNPLLWNNGSTTTTNDKYISEDTIIDSFKEAWLKKNQSKNDFEEKIIGKKMEHATIIAPKKKERKNSTAVKQNNLEGKLYCVCRQPYDARRFMIACDRCDDWFHGECIGINEKESEFIDLYFCRACSNIIGKKTSWKPKCSNPACHKAARIGSNLLGYLSKYCSDLCGLQVARARLELVEIKRRNSSTNKDNNSKSIIELALTKQKQSCINSIADEEDRQRLEEIKEEKRVIRHSLSVIKNKCHLLEQVVSTAAHSICGFDSRLISMNEDDKNNIVICQHQACLQHHRWKELFPVEFAQEKKEEYQRLIRLEKEKNQIKLRMKKRRDEKELMKNLGNMTYSYV
ncbi:MAG: hypothetical protein EXX96DRAFT_534872 [Benjaminiella poitrasii]|nr:MAG: hypothetical protein EXX96DRAFT_534872 [Benjaminiella poitrasii]